MAVQNDTTISEAVKAAALFLDQERPDWFTEINLNTFSFIKPCRCIIGQLADEGSAREWIDKMCWPNLIGFGFTYPDWRDEDWRNAHEEWVKQIRLRLEAASDFVVVDGTCRGFGGNPQC